MTCSQNLYQDLYWPTKTYHQLAAGICIWGLNKFNSKVNSSYSSTPESFELTAEMFPQINFHHWQIYATDISKLRAVNFLTHRQKERKPPYWSHNILHTSTYLCAALLRNLRKGKFSVILKLHKLYAQKCLQWQDKRYYKCMTYSKHQYVC